jgi:hypothetical protein
MDFKIGVSTYHQYYSEGGRNRRGDCIITTFTRNGVTYQKSYEETTIQVLFTRVRGLKLDNTVRFPSGLVAPHEGSSTAPRFKGVDCGDSWRNARRPLRMRWRTRPCTTPQIKRLWENP